MLLASVDASRRIAVIAMVVNTLSDMMIFTKVTLLFQVFLPLGSLGTCYVYRARFFFFVDMYIIGGIYRKTTSYQSSVRTCCTGHSILHALCMSPDPAPGFGAGNETRLSMHVLCTMQSYHIM